MIETGLSTGFSQVPRLEPEPLKHHTMTDFTSKNITLAFNVLEVKAAVVVLFSQCTSNKINESPFVYMSRGLIHNTTKRMDS